MVAGKEAESRMPNKKGSPRPDHEKETSNNITYERLAKQVARLRENSNQLQEKIMICEKTFTIVDATLEELQSIIKKW